MDLNENIRNNIQRLRRERNITQDILAAALEISVQAISKWETGASLPDIMQLPRIAEFFGVTIDYLFYHAGNEKDDKETVMIKAGLPEDDILRIVQFKGNRLLGTDLWEKDKAVKLIIPDSISPDRELHVEIWGSANIQGDIQGYLESGGGVNCGNIGSYLESSQGVNCGNVGGYLEAGGGVNCGNIGQYVECSGGGVSCGNIGQYVECDGSIVCGDIKGNVECAGDIKCNAIHGNVECNGDISYEK